jgi:hypothetical protein
MVSVVRSRKLFGRHHHQQTPRQLHVPPVHAPQTSSERLTIIHKYYALSLSDDVHEHTPLGPRRTRLNPVRTLDPGQARVISPRASRMSLPFGGPGNSQVPTPLRPPSLRPGLSHPNLYGVLFWIGFMSLLQSHMETPPPSVTVAPLQPWDAMTQRPGELRCSIVILSLL